MNLRQRLYTQPAHQIAFVYEDEQVTYSALCTRIETIAAYLAAHGVQPHMHVALIMHNDRLFIESLYAIWTLGAVAVPINPDYTAAERDYILKDGNVTFAITNQAIDMPHVEARQLHEIQATTYAATTVEESDTALILYTSGTTGKPKGAMLSHGNLYSNARDVATFFLYEASDKMLVVLPMFHVFALTVAVNAPLFAGATLIIHQTFSPAKALADLERYDVTLFAGVPLMYNYMLQIARDADLSSLRLAISGGSPLPRAIHTLFFEQFHVSISEGYGLSEASPVTCFNPPGRERVGTVGTAIPNVKLAIIDEGFNLLAPGRVGELVVRGPNVMKGYYENTLATSAAFANGHLRTGDLAIMDQDGYVTIIDRKKDMILVGGYNVYPKEVEEVLYTYTGIQEAAVVGKKNEAMDEEVVAYIVANTLIDEAVLKAYCAEKLVRYKCPSRIIQREALPKNSTGKILKYKL